MAAFCLGHPSYLSSVIHDGWRIGLGWEQLVTTTRPLPGQSLGYAERNGIYDVCSRHDPRPLQHRYTEGFPNGTMQWTMLHECLLS
jgi:hypothetical protein